MAGRVYGHGVRGRIATGPDMGKRIRTWGGRGESEEPEPSARRCANVDGFSVHANVSLRAHQRAKLENLCRYMLRPPLAVERLERLASGRLAYRMKTAWRDGTTHVMAKLRPSIVPVPPPASTAAPCGHRNTAEEQNPHPRNYTWAQLMARIFAVDVLECPRCGSRMRILAAIEDPSVAGKILDCLGLPSRPPPVAPARRDRQDALPEF